jgi:hypothetical protein
MTLTIKIPDTCPIRAKCSRRTIAELELAKMESGIYQLDEHVVSLGKNNSLIVEATYVPTNAAFSIIARHRDRDHEVYVLAAGAESQFLPASFVFRLPTQHFIEVYLEHN